MKTSLRQVNEKHRENCKKLHREQLIGCQGVKLFSKHWSSGPMLCVCVCVSVCVFTFEVLCPIFLDIQNSWGKVMERSGLGFEHFCLELV